jgi:hypothetical protein
MLLVHLKAAAGITDWAETYGGQTEIDHANRRRTMNEPGYLLDSEEERVNSRAGLKRKQSGMT